MTHIMKLTKTYPTGAEEWFCPTCKRLLVLQWPPKYRRIVLETGDMTVDHTGSKGGLRISSVKAEADADLELWRTSLDGIDFDQEIS